MDGSLKIPQRWLEGAHVLLQQNIQPEVTALGIAAWIRYCEGRDEQENVYTVDDPMAENLKQLLVNNQNTEDRVHAFLETKVFADMDIQTFPDFIHKICGYLDALNQHGTKHTMSLHLTEATDKEDTA
jgi:fructuronate reductase